MANLNGSYGVSRYQCGCTLNGDKRSFKQRESVSKNESERAVREFSSMAGVMVMSMITPSKQGNPRSFSGHSALHSFYHYYFDYSSGCSASVRTSQFLLSSIPRAVNSSTDDLESEQSNGIEPADQ